MDNSLQPSVSLSELRLADTGDRAMTATLGMVGLLINAPGDTKPKLHCVGADGALILLALMVLAVGLMRAFPAIVVSHHQPAAALVAARVPGGGGGGARLPQAWWLGGSRSARRRW